MRLANITRGVLALCLIALTVGCAQPVKQMYIWEDFPRQQYNTLLRSGANQDDQIRTLQAHAEKARANGATLPPGFRAHLGMLYLGAGNIGEARSQWQAEKVAFPESATYMDQLLKRIDAPAKTGATL